MQRLKGVTFRTKFSAATAVLIAAMLAFVGDASAAPKWDIEIGPGSICECRGGCRVVTTCLAQYCIQETRCSDCEITFNCERITQRSKPEEKLCLYRRGNACVTRVKTYRPGVRSAPRPLVPKF
jgi:hypothetical protein